ncbi:MAG: SRPBCC family protein [Acidimicrobiia bacterium]|nr:SRPBCC family protein [Acidimicrobiia bacterium]
MDLTADLDASCTPDELFAWVADLERYPRWLGIVDRVEPAAAADGDVGPAHVVDLAARVGPFSRSKRLRMVRSQIDEALSVVFERRETDGREHGTWRLTADVESRPGGGAHLSMRLHYGGRLWGPVLEPILHDEIERSKERLLRLVAGAHP